MSKYSDCDALIKATPFTVTILTLGGEHFCLDGLTLDSTVLDVKRLLAEQLSVDPDTLNFLHGTKKLLIPTKRLAEVGLQAPKDTLTMIRTAGTALNQSLLSAIAKGRNQEAIELINVGAGFDSKGCPVREIQSTVLHLAIRANMEDLVFHLIASEADINVTNEMGRQPLCVATIKRMSDVVVALIEAKADTNHKDSTGRTAKQYAKNMVNFKLTSVARGMLLDASNM